MKYFIYKFILFQILFIIFINVFKYSQIPYFFTGLLGLLVSFILLLAVENIFLRNTSLKDSLIIFLLTLNFFTIVPLTSSRSLSMYLLTNLVEYKVFEKEDVNFILNKYILSDSGSDKRIDEQKSIGNFVEENNESYLLSSRALIIVKVSEIIKKVYGIK